jgi:putative hemolysin
MIVGLVLGLVPVAVAAVLCLVTFVQLLYLESQRLRPRESAALALFKESIEERIGNEAEAPVALALVKHTGLLGLAAPWLALAWMVRDGRLAAVAEAAAGSWLLMVLCCYAAPQLLYRKTSGRWLVAAVPLLRGMVLVLRPLTALFGFLESLAELGGAGSEGPAEVGDKGDIEALITAGEEEGILEREDRKLIESVVAFGDKTVREVMTPRPKMVAIEGSKTLESLRQLVIHEQYSRIPVYEETIDQIIGFVHVRDMFELDEEERAKKQIRDLLRGIKHVPETKPVSALLREMQEERAHMAIVVDEYGNTAGLVTMEDLVEEILGEIRDEHEPDQDVKAEPEGSFVVAGSLDVSRLEGLLGVRTAEETESTTVGGLAAEWLGHVPQPGETVERDGIRIEVLAGNDLRVEQVRVSRAPMEHHG